MISYKKISDSENFHLFMLLNYPNMNDAKRALKANLISRKQYRAILLAHIEGRMPPQNTALGGAIGIHGIGVETKDKLEIHQFADWTKGCIAMRNDEVEVLRRYISQGTRVIITD
jgi:murein L,D-transpeptidase YafK